MILTITINLDQAHADQYIKVRLDPHPGDDVTAHSWADTMPPRLRKVSRILGALRIAVKANKFF